MSSDVSVRRASTEDLPRILDLVRDGLGEGSIPRTVEYWRWKHIENAFGVSPILLAESEERLVGLRAFMRWTWHSGDRLVTAVRAVDTATHPDFRGQGIFRRLTIQLRYEVGQEGTAFVYNTPNSQSRPGYLKMGWAPVGKPTLWIRPVQPLRLARALRREGVGGLEGVPPEIDGLPVAEVLDRPGIQSLIESAAEISIAPLHTPLSLRYLRWRYASISGFSYYGVSKGEGSDGALLILRSRRRGVLRELRVCELVVGPTRAACKNARLLLRRVPYLADVDVVLAMDAGRPALRRSLFASAYFPAPRSGPMLTTFVFQAVQGIPDPRRLSSWGATIGDLELF